MPQDLRAFGDTAKGLIKNPLGIIALFIVLVYGFAALVTTFASSLSPGERLPLVWFLVLFPVLVLVAFVWLVSRHGGKLYGPADYKDEENYIRMQLRMETKVKADVASSREHMVEKLKATLENRQIPAEVQEELLTEVKSTFRGLELKTTSEATAGSSPPFDLVAPGLPRVIRWLGENKKNFKFFGVKHLRETVFVSDPVAQDALQYAIDRGLVELYKVPNPKRPAFPTTALRLNLNHPLVQQILGESSA